MDILKILWGIITLVLLYDIYKQLRYLNISVEYLNNKMKETKTDLDLLDLEDEN